jgi:nucleotide sugar dehydrogenase
VANIIGIVGQGFVGTAVHEGMKDDFDIQTYDKFKSESSTCASLEDLCKKVKIVFVCLPTPMKKDGSCDLSILEDTICQINNVNSGNIVIIKSTVVPGTTERLNKENNNIDIVFNPEFLTEANSIEDFKNQNRIIIGGPRPATTIVKNMYRKSFRDTPIVKTGSTIAEFVKYFINCFLATKVAYANEFKQLCDAQGVDYDKVVEYALYDKRIATTHLSVPGPDGKDGFGGSCFPKDLNALINFAKINKITPSVLGGVWEKNLDVRPEKDWEQLKGRAVSE